MKFLKRFKMFNSVILKSFFVLSLVIGFVSTLQGQSTVSGNLTPTVGTTSEYSYWDDAYYMVTAPTWTIAPSGAASVSGIKLTADRYGCKADVTFNTAGSVTITVTYAGTTVGTLTVAAAQPNLRPQLSPLPHLQFADQVQLVLRPHQVVVVISSDGIRLLRVEHTCKV